MSPDERFYSKVVVTTSGCHEWYGAVSGNGYGNFWFQGKTVPAHRMAWYFAFGSWPERVLDHTCRNTICVNVQHLEDVTYGENTARGKSKTGRKNPLTCASGKHAWEGANVGSNKKGAFCKECKADRQRERRANQWE